MVDVRLSYWGRSEILYVQEIYRDIFIVIRSRNNTDYLIIVCESSDMWKLGQSTEDCAMRSLFV